MILDPTGTPVKSKVTETTLEPRLVTMLAELEGVLQQTGLTLTCIRCRAFGLPDLARGSVSDSGAIFSVTCSCSSRVCDTRTGRVKVALH